MSTRMRGLGVAAGGLVAALVGVIVVRLQAGSHFAVIPFATVIGWIFFAVGLFQAISGRDEARRGIGWLGLVFVVVVGGLGSLGGFWIAFPSRAVAPEPVAPRPDRLDRELRDVSDGLSHVTVEPVHAQPTAR